MYLIGRAWRWLGDNSGRLFAVIAVVGIGANVVTGAIQGWLKFPWPVKVAGVIGVVALIALAVRTWRTWWPWLKGLFRSREQAAGMTQTFMAAAPGAQVSDVRVWGSTMRQSSGTAPVRPMSGVQLDEVVKRKCKGIADELFVLVAGGEAVDRTRMTEFRERRMRIQASNASDAEKEAEVEKIREEEDREILQPRPVMREYDRRFVGPALALLDQLEAKGWTSPAERDEIEHPTNPLGVRAVAVFFARIGAQP